MRAELLWYLEMGLCLQSSRVCLSVYCSHWNTGLSLCWTSDCLNPGLWIRPMQVLHGAQYDQPEAEEQQYTFIVCFEQFSAQGSEKRSITLDKTQKRHSLLNYETDICDKLWPLQMDSEVWFFPPLRWMFAVQEGHVSRSWLGCCHSCYH